MNEEEEYQAHVDQAAKVFAEEEARRLKIQLEGLNSLDYTPAFLRDRDPEDEDDVVSRPSHYTQYKQEPVTFIMTNDLPFWMGNVIKYVMRADDKNGVEDLRKAQRYIEMRINQMNGKDVL